MRMLFLVITVLFSITCLDGAENLSTRAFYSNFLFSERSHPESHLNFEGFIDNTINHVKDPKNANIKDSKRLPRYSMKDVREIIGKIHNIMHDTFYTCSRTAPKADSFADAVNGTNTPDSHHYASLLHSALSIRGVQTDFFKTPYHYGLHYTDPATGAQMFWCIITPLSMQVPPSDIKTYVTVFNRYRNRELNPTAIKESDIRMVSVDEFADMNMPNRYR